jgi:hypothetical protein
MARNHALLARGDDANFYLAFLSADAFARPIIGRTVDPRSQPFQPFAYLLPYCGAVFADAAGVN